ncbi:aldehyde reductase 2 [Phanerochaete sordida]|uniref:Aldehyde reductase 2 n=1 Tax=Phanerochaete sordida TaxID=48140 RepID=A0A9P3G628_9APHY|nr:aldehyde reductase 2 [Phanerochaete sordida]
MAPPVNPGSLVLVTGVNGHLASATALRLLQKGYRVRGTVRALKSGAYVRKEFKEYGDNFDVAEVPDISVPGAFDAALQGADAVVHAAAPVTYAAKRTEEFYVPSIEGTLSILRSAQKIPSVKRFLYLGSLGSVVMNDKDPHKELMTRDDWNIMAPKFVQHLDDPHIGFHIYIASKLEAEKAAWHFMKTQKPHFTFTAVLGASTFGPVHKELTGPPRADQGLGQVYNLIADPPRVEGLSPIKSMVWVHVYDVADLFVASLTSDKTLGKRLMAVAGRMSFVESADIVAKAFPDRRVPPADPNAFTLQYHGAEVIEFDTALEKELLGGDWRTLEDAMTTCARDLIEKEAKGWDKPQV